ncbi:hypothetical protein D8780_01480 [Notoacmeibacter ruber]|uniref:Uncharacterized protein n=1 Tax=Notoacmeibacter ruber TaxID=2670375 RepID=A0A3L7JC16_9HYPH|nr:hypothetical protein D8780_01480 [Notoacmeibacter ruber]
MNWQGITANGDDVNLHASADQVRLGHMINAPILAEYPDGTLKTGNLVRITPAGLEWLRRNAPVELRRPEGGEQ